MKKKNTENGEPFNYFNRIFISISIYSSDSPVGELPDNKQITKPQGRDVKKLIAKNDLGNAFKLLESIELQKEQVNELVKLRALFEQLSKDKLKGEITREVYTAQITNFCDSLLKFVDEVLPEKHESSRILA